MENNTNAKNNKNNTNAKNNKNNKNNNAVPVTVHTNKKPTRKRNAQPDADELKNPTADAVSSYKYTSKPNPKKKRKYNTDDEQDSTPTEPPSSPCAPKKTQKDNRQRRHESQTQIET